MARSDDVVGKAFEGIPGSFSLIQNKHTHSDKREETELQQRVELLTRTECISVVGSWNYSAVIPLHTDSGGGVLWFEIFNSSRLIGLVEWLWI